MQQLDPTLSITQLDVALGGKPILRGVSLTGYPGELVAVLGPNGAGKSTLLRTISGQVKPRRGRAMIAGKDPAKSSAARRSLGIVPQRVALFGKLTAKENLLAFGALMGVQGRRARSRVETLMERVQLKHRMNEPVHRLSGGMQRRVNIAAALMHRPSLLVLDEPAQNLDITGQLAFYKLLDRIYQERGLSVLMVSHDLHLVMSSTKNVVCLSREICCHGEPRHVTKDPEFISLFGPDMAQLMASYQHHHHDHDHDHDHSHVHSLTDKTEESSASHHA